MLKHDLRTAILELHGKGVGKQKISHLLRVSQGAVKAVIASNSRPATKALRAQMLGLARTSATCSGLLVLLSQGVSAWMAHRSPDPEPPPLSAASPLVDHRHAALVRVLASMAIATSKEART